MNGVPSIGGTRGIFEIFIPGAFLLLNITFVVHTFIVKENDFSDIVNTISVQPVPGLIILVCFGYLLGVLLRLLKTPFVDTLSGRFNSVFFYQTGSEDSRICKEAFPYFEYISKLSKTNLPDIAHTFYGHFWGKFKRDNGNREFYNYCKTIINAIDARSSSEIYAAEALTRYVTSMFYALTVSLPFVLAASFISLYFLLFVFAYLISMAIILKNLRFLRVKEVEIVFVASMKNYFTEKWPKSNQTAIPQILANEQVTNDRKDVKE
ncbi:MAG TPA: hypothetical protein PKN44_11685 [Bacteroidales bacterium]|nr:hypothetical protein [Bacteroidales bacterium]